MASGRNRAVTITLTTYSHVMPGHQRPAAVRFRPVWLSSNRKHSDDSVRSVLIRPETGPAGLRLG